MRHTVLRIITVYFSSNVKNSKNEFSDTKK